MKFLDNVFVFVGALSTGCAVPHLTADLDVGGSQKSGGTTSTLGGTTHAGGTGNVAGKSNGVTSAGGTRNAAGNSQTAGANNIGGTGDIGSTSNGGTAGSSAATTGNGGTVFTGGTAGSGGTASTGGKNNGGAVSTGGTINGGANATGGRANTGGVTATAASAGRAATGGTVATGGTTGGVATGGAATGGAATGGVATGGTSAATVTCTPSTATGTNVSGSGTYHVTVETNSDPGIIEGTIFRPTELGGTEKFPIFVWGEGACVQNGLSNSVAMAEIASHGYFVIADGIPNGSGSRSMTSDTVTKGKPLLAYITWAIAENEKPCSVYYQRLDTKKIAANGFSCGGIMATGTAGDPRITTWGLNSSGLFSEDQGFYNTIHTPVLIVLGGTSDTAYANGLRDYTNISKGNTPVMLFSKAGAGHGGDLFAAQGGDFAKIDLAWLNWWLKGDETKSGKGLLVGPSCPYCTDSAWEVRSSNIP